MPNPRPLFLCALLAGCLACAKEKGAAVSELGDEPELAKVRLGDVPEFAPAYGIVVGASGAPELEVNIEAEDGPRVSSGEDAVADLMPSKSRIPCKVARVLRAASFETGQSIAWLKPTGSVAGLPRGEFVFANITIGMRRHVLTVPKEAVFIKEGRSWVIRKGAEAGKKAAFEPVSVQTGAVGNGTIEVKSGLAAGEEVVTRGGLGFLFPDFKSSAAAD